MKGFVKNNSNEWAHALKRSIGPFCKISLDELYEQYGVKHEIPDGKEFVDWLRNVKLKDTQRWIIKLDDEIDTSSTISEEEVAPVTKTITHKPRINADKFDSSLSNNTLVSPVMAKNYEVTDIINMSVRRARNEMPKIKDIKLLKYAVKEADQLTGKESLCQVIRKRIRELGG